jgi:hypothetical protein
VPSDCAGTGDGVEGPAMGWGLERSFSMNGEARTGLLPLPKDGNALRFLSSFLSVVRMLLD